MSYERHESTDDDDTSSSRYSGVVPVLDLTSTTMHEHIQVDPAIAAEWTQYQECIPSTSFVSHDRSTVPLHAPRSPRVRPNDHASRDVEDLPGHMVTCPKRKAATDHEGSDQSQVSHAVRSRQASTKRRATEGDLNDLPGHSRVDAQPAATARPSPGAANIRMPLPPGNVFPIQVGERVFRLSGASISSDAPSYFSKFFQEQLDQDGDPENIRPLYIDRDAATFEDIARHLQGYHVEPRDGTHFVRLFADAQFYSLPRLTARLFSTTIFVRIGDREFRIPRDVFGGPGDSPNYFSLGFSIFFTTPGDSFPGLAQQSLLRPPSILPPAVPNRCAKTFAEILHFLKGYPIQIRSEEHREELLRDARYFHLKGLEQRLIRHQISYNLARKRTEIVIRLEDIRQSGVSFLPDVSPPTMIAAPVAAVTAINLTASSTPSGSGWVYYQRPYVDPEAHALTLEIGGEEACCLSLISAPRAATVRYARAIFFRQAQLRLASLFSVIANKMNLPNTQPLGVMMEQSGGLAGLPPSIGRTGISQERVKVCIGAEADVTVNGQKWSMTPNMSTDKPRHGHARGQDHRRRRREESESSSSEDEEEGVMPGEDWIVSRAHWRIRIVQSITPSPGGNLVHAGNAGGTGGSNNDDANNVNHANNANHANQPPTANAGTAQATSSAHPRQTSSQPDVEVCLYAVKLEAHRSERGRNAARGFLL